MNITIISGNLGSNPTLRQTASGLAVVNLNVATNERAKQDGEYAAHTEWHNVTVFGKQAEICGKSLTKGAKVTVKGKLRTRKWTDKDGIDRWNTEIIADSVEFARQAQAPRPPEPMPAAVITETAAFGESGVPF